MSDTKLL